MSSKQVKLVARQISIAEVQARQEELLQLYLQVRLMLGDNKTTALLNARELLNRSLTTGVIVETYIPRSDKV